MDTMEEEKLLTGPSAGDGDPKPTMIDSRRRTSVTFMDEPAEKKKKDRDGAGDDDNTEPFLENNLSKSNILRRSSSSTSDANTTPYHKAEDLGDLLLAGKSFAANNHTMRMSRSSLKSKSSALSASVSIGGSTQQETCENSELQGGKRSSIQNYLNCASDNRTIDEQIIQQKESRSILCLRLLTTTTLITAAVIVAALTYSYSHSAELTEFQTQYNSSVVKVEEAIGMSIGNKLNTAKTFAAMYTSRYGADDIWPNVTMPDFQHIAVGQLDIADGIALSYNPVINGTAQRQEFEAHAAEVAHRLGATELVDRSCDACRVVSDGIFRKTDGVVVNDPGISPESRYPDHMVPVWQIFPTKVNWRAVMFNLHSETNRQRALDDMLEHQVPTITALLHLVQHDEMNPSSILFYPVFDRFVEQVEGEEENKYKHASSSSSTKFFPNLKQRRIEGSISIVFTWEDILRRVLPSYIEGMIVVLESSVSSELPRQLWTYEVNGEDVTLLGEGDLHDPAYDDLEHRVRSNVAKSAEELGIVDYLIEYEMRMYPSKRFEHRYVSNRPLIMTIVVVCIFVMTSLIFLAYDYLVKNRQNAVMAFASRSGRIVNSLFPENVRGRLMDNADHYAGTDHSGDARQDSSRTLLRGSGRGRRQGADEHDDGDEDSNTMGTRTSIKSSLSGSIKSFLGRAAGGSRRSSTSSAVSEHRQFDKRTMMRRASTVYNAATPGLGASAEPIVNLMTPPIADLFPETSIMFADIVGFTEWSSNHSPEEVFHLLETLFYEFDRLASRMNVFKLGTIGDCYIAVTGIPDARDDHAEVLCLFAEKCRVKTNRVVAELEPSLGGTTKLSMRFGIHSGPVTAGVLRGQKSRFELFGDTINTASRMESNGMPNKIQVSQDTADFLIEAGYEDWVKPRKELVKAKGKGMLQTYWFDLDLDPFSEELDVYVEVDEKKRTEDTEEVKVTVTTDADAALSSYQSSFQSKDCCDAAAAVGLDELSLGDSSSSSSVIVGN